MIEALRIPEENRAVLAPPRFEVGKPMLFVGLSARHSFAAPHAIPGQWREFMARYGEIPDKISQIPVGVSANMDDEGDFDYLCAVEVKRFSGAPRELSELRIPAQSYAVFLHREHVSKIGATYAEIWGHWLPDHAKTAADGANLERHLETFDPNTGLGGVEIWIPMRDAA